MNEQDKFFKQEKSGGLHPAVILLFLTIAVIAGMAVKKYVHADFPKKKEVKKVVINADYNVEKDELINAVISGRLLNYKKDSIANHIRYKLLFKELIIIVHQYGKYWNYEVFRVDNGWEIMITSVMNLPQNKIKNETYVKINNICKNLK